MRVDGKQVITKAEWLEAGLTQRQFQYDCETGSLTVVGSYKSPMIVLSSIKRAERLAMIEAKFGPMDREEGGSRCWWREWIVRREHGMRGTERRTGVRWMGG